MPPTAVLQKTTEESTTRRRVTREDIIQRIVTLGHERSVVEKLMSRFDEVSGLRDLVAKNRAFVTIDTGVHGALDDIMKGHVVEAPPGSIHADLNALYALPAGQTFVHSQRQYCSLEIRYISGS